MVSPLFQGHNQSVSSYKGNKCSAPRFVHNLAALHSESYLWHSGRLLDQWFTHFLCCSGKEGTVGKAMIITERVACG